MFMRLQYTKFRFPFVDLLGDGHSHFSYVPSSFISKHPIVVSGFETLGEKVVVSTFQPPSDPYAFVPADRTKKSGEYFFNAYKNDLSVLNTTFAPKPVSRYFISPYPLSL